MMTQAPSLPFLLASGAAARVTEFSAGRTILESPEPAPPGSTVRGTINGLNCPLEVKVRNCRRLAPEGVFLIEGRLQNARRELLQRLNALG